MKQKSNEKQTKMGVRFVCGVAAMTFAVASAFTPANAQENPLWMRHSAISPDGSTIAFTYKGDIFTVPATGGKAVQVTTSPNYDSNPIWSPNGKQIVFSSDRYGTDDIFIVDAQGGTPTRLTTYAAGAETPIAFLNDSTVLFSANILPDVNSRQFPGGTFSQVYTVKTRSNVRPVMFSSLPMENICISKDGKSLLYTDKKGYEDQYRKHHTSSIARDVWQATANEKFGVLSEKKSDAAKGFNYSKLTSFKGEDRNAVYAPDGKSVYYLSEEDGTFNIWRAELNGNTFTGKQQITKYKGNPIRFLTIANNGTLCFGYDGEIYTMTNGTQPKRVPVNIVADDLGSRNQKVQMNTAAASIGAVSKDGKQIAFIYRGDVYVTSVDYATTKQITNTPEQERNVDFAPDGRSVVYSSERDGLWQIYKTSIVNDNEKLFPYATELKEERVTKTNNVSFNPKYSPNGKEIAFLENRTTVKVIDLKSGKDRVVMDGKYEYSYSDGDQSFEWSPDGKWILSNFIGNGGWNSKDVVLLDASGNGKMVNLTNSGYTDVNAEWVLGGKAMMWYSDRAGYRSHGSWGAEDDIYLMFFDLDAYERFNMSKEELALLEEQEKADKEKADKEKKEKAEKGAKGKKEKKDTKLPDKDSDKKDDEVKPLELDLENAEYRIVRLTNNSSKLAGAVMSPKGDKLYYLTSFEGPADLWVKDLREGSTKILVKGAGYGSMFMSKDGKTIYMGGRTGFKKIDVSNGSSKNIPCEFTYEYKPQGERAYMYDHVWRQVKEKFYKKDLHGVDWEAYRTTYNKFLPYINNDKDFAFMLSELLGELNASHTGARYRGSKRFMATASLGVFYDEDYKGDGLKIKEIIRRSPLDLIKTQVKNGDIIEKIDGVAIKAGEDYFPLLEGKAGKKVLLSIYSPVTKTRFTQQVKAINAGELNSLLYDRWVNTNKKEVELATNGKIGYIHIEGMDSPSFRVLYRELLGRYRDCESVIIDTRHNGGGWLHDDVVTLLSAKQYTKYVPRDQFIGKDPYNKWTKPSCMLVCEDNYSNAHGTPWLYKEMKVGKLVGAPVPGTMTAVWWETLMTGTVVFGIPQVGCVDNNGDYLENKELEPDVYVLNPAADVMNGKDAQLETAIELMLKGEK